MTDDEAFACTVFTEDEGQRPAPLKLSARDCEWLLDLSDQPPEPPNAALSELQADYQRATGDDSSKPFTWPVASSE